MKRIVASVVAALTLAAASAAQAGYRVVEVDPEFPEDVTTTWYQGGLARVEGALEGLVVIVDVNKGEGWLIDAPAKRYAGGKLGDLASEVRKFEQVQSGGAASEGAGDPGASGEADRRREVQVKDLGPGERLQGYDTHRFQVLMGGEVLEELWLAPKLEVSREIDLAGFASAIQKMLGGGPGLGQGYEESEAYRALRAGGYPLRQVLYFVGEKSTLEVTSVTVQPFSDADFAIPKGYAKVGYIELLFGDAD